MACSLPGSSVHGILQARILEWVAHSLFQGLPNPVIEPRSPTLQADSLPSEPPGKPQKTGVGSLSLLQGILPTQDLNRGLLPCRWILDQLSYQGSQGPSKFILWICKVRKLQNQSPAHFVQHVGSMPWSKRKLHLKAEQKMFRAPPCLGVSSFLLVRICDQTPGHPQTVYSSPRGRAAQRLTCPSSSASISSPHSSS